MNETGYPLSGNRAYNRTGLAYLIFLAGMTLGSVLLGKLAGMHFPTFAEDGYGMVVSYIALYGIGFPLMMLVFARIPDCAPQREQPQKAMPLAVLLGLYPVCMLLATALNALSILLNYGIGYLLDNGYSADSLVDFTSQNLVVVVVVGVIIAPTMEELVFRKISYKKLGGYGKRSYILFTAVSFGLFHLNLSQFFYALALGLVFAKITWETGRVRYSIILHMLVNLTGGAGIGGFVLREGGEMGILIYGFFVLLLLFVGAEISLVWGVRWLVNRLRTRRVPAPREELRKNVLAPACVLYYLACAGLIAHYILSADFAQ